MVSGNIEVGVEDWVDVGNETNSIVGVGGCVGVGSGGPQAVRRRTIGTVANNASLIRITTTY